jgi:hypothetical protein
VWKKIFCKYYNYIRLDILIINLEKNENSI